MVILLWVASVLIIVVLGGELRFRLLKKEKKNESFSVKEEWNNSIDKDIDSLKIEMSSLDTVPMMTLLMRGSWRLAQGLNMDASDFAELKSYEYNKTL